MRDEPLAFFDTNILIYALNVSPGRSDIASRLLDRGGIVSVQVLNEAVSVARRKLGLAWDEVEIFLDAVRGLCRVAALTIETHEASVALSRRYGYAIYDSAILASAIESGCTVLYSEDMQPGQRVGGLTIVNPFRPA